MRKIAVRVVTCVYVFMLYLSMLTFSLTSFHSNISSNTLDLTYRLWEIWEHLLIFLTKKNYVALKNNSDDYIGEYVFMIHLFIYPLLLFNVTFNLITYLPYYMEHENRLKKKTVKSLIRIFLTQFTGSRAFTVFYFGRTLNLIIKVQTLRLTNFSGLVCKARLHVLTLSRRVTDRVRFISLSPCRLKEDLCVYCCCWQCRFQFIHATFEKSLLPIETDRPLIFQDADCGPS